MFPGFRCTAGALRAITHVADLYSACVDPRVTPGVLPGALRAALSVFKIDPGDFVAGMTLKRRRGASKERAMTSKKDGDSVSKKRGWRPIADTTLRYSSPMYTCR